MSTSFRKGERRHASSVQNAFSLKRPRAPLGKPGLESPVAGMRRLEESNSPFKSEVLLTAANASTLRGALN